MESNDRDLNQVFETSGAKQASFRHAQAAATALTESTRPSLRPLAQLLASALTAMGAREDGLEGFDLETGQAFNRAAALLEETHRKVGGLFNGAADGGEVGAREVESAGRVVAQLLASETALELFDAEVAHLQGWCDAVQRAADRRAALNDQLEAARARQRLIDEGQTMTPQELVRRARNEGFTLELNADGEIEVVSSGDAGSLSPVTRGLIALKYDALVELLKSRPTRRETLTAS